MTPQPPNTVSNGPNTVSNTPADSTVAPERPAMKAISLHQPWASLLITCQPSVRRCSPGCENCDPSHPFYEPSKHPMVKRFETRSWPCPPSIIGQHVAFASTKRKPDHGKIGNFRVARVAGNDYDAMWRLESGVHRQYRLPLGCVVGSGTITASYPIVENGSREGVGPRILNVEGDRLLLAPSAYYSGRCEDLSDQLPYGDWTPGRYAWLIEDAAPTTERCPWCWGTPNAPYAESTGRCNACFRGGRCDPIPVTGRQGFWNWTP